MIKSLNYAGSKRSLNKGDGRHWLIPYVAINLDGADVPIRGQPKQGLGRNVVAIGEVVGLGDRNRLQRSGRITRLND